ERVRAQRPGVHPHRARVLRGGGRGALPRLARRGGGPAAPGTGAHGSWLRRRRRRHHVRPAGRAGGAPHRRRRRARRARGGGRRADLPGRFFAPTVLADVTPEMAVMREETFGPVLPVMRVPDAETALRLANDTSMGLSGSVWSRDEGRARALARRLQAGSV